MRTALPRGRLGARRRRGCEDQILSFFLAIRQGGLINLNIVTIPPERGVSLSGQPRGDHKLTARRTPRRFHRDPGHS